jgi:adenylate cyclase
VQSAPGDKVGPQFHPETRAWWVVLDGELRFTIEQISGSPAAPLLLPAHRVFGDDGTYVSARELCESTGIELKLLQRIQRAMGLPRVDDPDAAVLLRADAQAAARAKLFLDLGIDPDDTVAVMRVVVEGLSHAAAIMRA